MKKLTEQQIEELIKKNPNTQMFDICVKCGGVEEYLNMNSTKDEESFDVVCDECINTKRYEKL